MNIIQKGGLALSYNQANRLATAQKPLAQGAMNATYSYNAQGVRSSKTVNGEVTHYVYSCSRLLAWKDTQGWHDNVILNGEILATVDNGHIHYHENDYQGKTLRLTNQLGNTVWESDWEPYREADSTSTTATNQVKHLQRFAGQILDEETGNYYNHFREYDPQTGRYMQSDPIGLAGGMNTYAYVGGNPVMFVDPLGLKTGALTANASAGWGVGGTVGVNVVFDDSGNIGLQVTGGVGGDTPGASVTGGLEYTEACTIDNLEGWSSQAGVDGGEGISVEAGSMSGHDYTGGYVGVGVGIGTPVGASGYVVKTHTVFSFNIPKVIKGIKKIWF